MDFSDNNPLLIYDWQTENYFWVMPKKNTEQAEQQGTNAKETEALSLESNALSASSDWTISSQIKINGVNVGENGLRIIDDASMSCSLSVSNNSDADREITALLATYTSTGALHDINVFNIDVDAQETVNTEIIYEFDAEKEHTGKLMFWDSLSSLIPLRTTIDFSQESGINAYYYNTDNRLLQVDKMNGKSILFTYDNMGNLLTRTVRE